jgi:hypothetical protein
VVATKFGEEKGKQVSEETDAAVLSLSTPTISS